MTENQISLSSSKEVEEAHIATVEQQIAENESAIQKQVEFRATERILFSSRMASSKETEQLLRNDTQRLKAKARVFRRAKFQIEEIDRQ